MNKISLRASKRFLSLLMVAMILVTSLPVINASANQTTAKTTTYVNFRTGPSTTDSVITIFDPDTPVTVLDTSNSEWTMVVSPGGAVGYVFSQYLTGSSSNSGGSSSTGGNAVTTAYVNFRTGPSTSDSVISVLSEGTAITIVDTSNSEWTKVKTSSGTEGYIFSIYVQSTGNSGGSGSSGGSTTSDSYITNATVNLRSGKSTSTSVITVVNEGTTLTVTDKSDSSWYGVKLSSGTTGYIYAIYLDAVSQSTATPAPTQTPSTGGSGDVYQTTTVVNVRSSASTSSTVLSVLDTGTKVTVTDTSQKPWYAVTLSSGTKGYMHSDYLQFVSAGSSTATPAPTPTPTPNPGASESYVTNATVNVRSGQSTNHSIVALLPTGTTVTVTDKSNSEWYGVKLSDGTTGYIFQIYLTPVSTSATATPSPTPVVTGKYLRVTASSGLNFRDAPNGNLISVLTYGEILTKLAEPSDGWVNVQTSLGVSGYVSTSYVEDYSPTAGSVDVSSTNVSVNQYKTYYVSASVSSGSQVIWKTSDSNVATVVNGFIYGVSPGSCTVTATDSSGTSVKNISVTVTGTEAVRFAAASPNSPSANTSFNLSAITDSSKTSVRFEIVGVGTYDTTSYTAESASYSGYATNNVRIFSTSVSLNAGTYTVRAYSSGGGGYSSDYREFTIKVVSSGDTKVTTNEERRASDEIISILANFEGFLQVVTGDSLAYGVPTVGYGYVVNSNTSFYNNLTKTEALLMLKDTVNDGTYTKSVNNLISANNLYMNQQQFDALVSFTYNVGGGWTSSSTVKDLLLNTIDYTALGLSDAKPAGAKIFLSTAVYDGVGSSKVVATLNKNTAINVTGYNVDSNNKLWYKITSSSFSGSAWVRGGNVVFNTTGKRDLNYIDPQIFAYKFLEWHNAGGNCIAGLLYRRNAEAKIFCYGNYAEAQHSNGNYYSNTYKFTYPSCMKDYE